MASDALRSQVAAKWQDAFGRLNRNEQGIAGLMAFSKAWNIALRVLHPRELGEGRDITDMDTIRTAFTIINAGRRLPFLLETFLEDLKQQYYLVERDVVTYMTRFDETEDPDIVRELVLRLVAWFKHWAPMSECVYSSVWCIYTLTATD